MRKFLSLVLLAAFTGLQTYQLCDASQDALEALQAVSQAISKTPACSNVLAAPDDDDDNMPSAYDDMLQPNAGSAVERVVPLVMRLIVPPAGEPPQGIFSTLHGPAPPHPAC